MKKSNKKFKINKKRPKILYFLQISLVLEVSGVFADAYFSSRLMLTALSESKNQQSNQIFASTSSPSTESTQVDLGMQTCFSPPPPFKFPSEQRYLTNELPKSLPARRCQLENDSTLFLKEITYKQKK